MILLRSTLFALWFYIGTFLTTVLGFPVLFMGRTRALRFAHHWAVAMLAGLRRLCGIDWQVTGLEHLPPDGPYLIASMHQSAFDTLVWIVLSPRICYVFKRELTRIPVFNFYLRATGMISIDRRAGGAAMRGLLRATDEAVAQCRQIVIFPEGTRVKPGHQAELLPGVAAMAARAKLPIIPVITDSGVLWGRRSFLKSSGTIHVEVLPALPVGLSRGETMARLAAVFAQAAAEQARHVDNSVHGASPSLLNRPS